ncbi:MAG: dimethylsulfonioproprionate lyase family protein [Pseudomonadota bacterium]
MTGRSLETRLDRFLAVLEEELIAAASVRHDLATAFGEIRREIERPPRPFTEQTTKDTAAARHLPRALELARAGPKRCVMLAEALADLEKDLVWLQNPNYNAENLGGHHIANHASSDLIGPFGLTPAPISVGLLLLGPGLHYPDHRHAAEEFYLTLTGGARWRCDQEPWVAHSPGTWIHHPPWMPHAMETDATPLLALFVWRGALDRPAELCNAPD